MDDQIRVDRDASGRTTSEGQAYAMTFSLVANDRPRFDALLGWTERNLAAGDLTLHLPAWLWGCGENDVWGVLDANSASDADVWMAYALLEAGRAWNEPPYTSLGTALANRIASSETVDIPELGVVLLPAPNGFRHENSVRLNASYLPLQLFIRLAQVMPDGPWRRIADRIPAVVRHSSPSGFPADWLDVVHSGGPRASSGST